MTKVMTPEIKEATVGDFIQAEDLVNSPIKLKITAVELEVEAVTSSGGKPMDKVTFYFENNKGQTKEIGVLAFDSLVRRMNEVDPDVGDVLQLQTKEVIGSKYLVWDVEIIQKAKGNVAPKKPAKPVKEEEVEEDEKIKLEDIPF